MKKVLFLVLIVLLTAYYFFHDVKAEKEQERVVTSDVIDEQSKTDSQNSLSGSVTQEDTVLPEMSTANKEKEVTSFTGYKIIVPPQMKLLGKETQAFGLDGKARKAELRLKDTISGTMLIVSNLYAPYGERLFEEKAKNVSPIAWHGGSMLADTMTFDKNGRGQELDTPQKVIDVLIKTPNSKIYELKLKTTTAYFEKDSKWFARMLDNFNY